MPPAPPLPATIALRCKRLLCGSFTCSVVSVTCVNTAVAAAPHACKGAICCRSRRCQLRSGLCRSRYTVVWCCHSTCMALQAGTAQWSNTVCTHNDVHVSFRCCIHDVCVWQDLQHVRECPSTCTCYGSRCDVWQLHTLCKRL